MSVNERIFSVSSSLASTCSDGSVGPSGLVVAEAALCESRSVWQNPSGGMGLGGPGGETEAEVTVQGIHGLLG
ncbi:unnamed protein product [Protopolystoma xenopodis]|uniref:Uncharacterized protein n=1 Tax=Protopolystoma xenopodis TaxID=117903 RepID=A0A448XHN6_9PLAT|nr:unnamed protein product [Protopolystoma xenopodis]